MIRKTLVIALLVSLTFALPAQGEVVSTILTLDAPTPTVNTINLALLGPGDIQVGTTGVSSQTGTIEANINIDRSTGEITFLDLTGGNIIGSPWTIAGVPGLGDIVATATTATADTIPGAPNFSVVTNSSFVAAEHLIQLTGGTANSDLGTTNLAPADIPGSGNGSLTSTLNGDQFDIVFSMDIDNVQDFDGQNMAITGTIVARGSVTAIPEPSGTMALATLACTAMVRRRRR